jgi:dihydropteroate synthase
MQATLNCKGRIISIEDPIIMGVINLNNDSFYPGSRLVEISQVLNKIGIMVSEGASIIDIGFMSSKPGSSISNPDEESKAIIYYLKEIREVFPDVFLSIDTLHSSVAKAAILHGADIINDITAGDYDKEMMHTVAELEVPYIMMHMQGMPENMQNTPQYENVVYDILVYLKDKIGQARHAGIKDVIIDPGFGFGKTIEHNFWLLNHLSVFNLLDLPILAGLSRKSMIWKTLEITPSQALNGTTALNFFALQQGAKILRVHDVKEAVECVKLFKALMTTV